MLNHAEKLNPPTLVLKQIYNFFQYPYPEIHQEGQIQTHLSGKNCTKA